MSDYEKRGRGRPKNYSAEKHTCGLPFRCRTRKGHCCCVDCDRCNGCEARCLNGPDRCGQYHDPVTTYYMGGKTMKIIKNNFQKTLGFTICHKCKSVLRIEKTDVFYKNVRGKTASFFTCAACGHEQAFLRKDLMSQKRALEESVQG